MIGLAPDKTEARVVRHGLLRLKFADGLTGDVEVLDSGVIVTLVDREGFLRPAGPQAAVERSLTDRSLSVEPEVREHPVHRRGVLTDPGREPDGIDLAGE